MYFSELEVLTLAPAFLWSIRISPLMMRFLPAMLDTDGVKPLMLVVDPPLASVIVFTLILLMLVVPQ